MGHQDAFSQQIKNLAAATDPHDAVRFDQITGLTESDSFGISNLGNTSGTSGVASGPSIRAIFAGGNNVTLSQSLVGASATITISAANQTNQTLGVFATSNTTQSSSGTIDARSLTFAGAGIASVGISNGSVVISVPSGGGGAGTNTFGESNLGNTAGTSGVISGSAVQLIFAGGNNVTLSQSINGSSATITISAFNQTNQTLGLFATSNTTQSSSGTVDARSLTFAGAGIASVGITGASVVVSVPAPAAQTNQTLGLFATSNTTQSASGTVDARSLTFAGAGGASVGVTGNSVVISVPVASQGSDTLGISNVGNTSGTSGVVSGSNVQMIFAGGNNVTLSQSVNGSSATITISAAAQTNQTIGLFATSNTTQSSSGTVDARSLTFAGAGIASVGITGGSVVVSVLATQGTDTFGISNLGNTAGTSGVISGAAVQFVFAGGNNVTLSQSINGSSATITVSAFNQTNQTIGLFATSNTTQSSSGTVDARSLTFAGAGIASVGVTGASVVVSVPAPAAQTNQTLGLFATSNTTQSSSGTVDARSLTFAGAGGASVGVTGNSVVISVPVASQGSDTLGISNVGNTSGTSGVVSGSNVQMIFAGGNNVTLSQSINGSSATITISAAAQTNQTIGLFATSNTTQSSSGTVDARSLTFAGAGIASVGVTGASVVVSVPSPPAQTNQTLGVFATSNTTQSSSGTIDARSLTFVGAGVASVGVTNGSVVISVPSGAAGTNTFGASNLGNTSGTSGVVSGSAVQFVFAGGNNVTLSQSINGSSATITISAAAQTNQTIGLFATGNTTQSSSGTVDARSLTFAGAGIASVGVTGASVVVSVPAPAAQTNQTLGLFATSNTTQSSSGTVDARSLTFAGAGAASVGITGASVVISVPVASQGSDTLGISNVGNTSGTSGVVSGSNVQMIFAGGNNVTLSQSINGSSATITISAAAQTNQTLGVFATSNTTQSSSGAIDARSLTFAGAGIASVGVTNGSIVISVPSGGGAAGTNTFGASNLGNTSGTSGVVSGSAVQFVFAGGNNVTLSQSINGSSATITISAFAQSNQTLGLFALGNTTQNSSTTLDARSLSLNGLGGMTVGYSNNSIQMSVPATSSLVGTGAVSIVTNVSTISIGAPVAITLFTFEPTPVNNSNSGFVSFNTATSGAASFFPFVVDENVAASMLNMALSVNFITGGTSSGRQTVSLLYGLYSQGTGTNSTTLGSLATSASMSFAVTYNNSTITLNQPTSSNSAGYTTGSTTSAGLNITSGYTGAKIVQLPVNSTIAPGNYWLGLFGRASTSSVNVGLSFSVVGANIGVQGAMAPIGSFSSAFTGGTNALLQIGGPWEILIGSFTSAGQTNLPVSVALSALSNSNGAGSVLPYMRFWSVQ